MSACSITKASSWVASAHFRSSRALRTLPSIMTTAVAPHPQPLPTRGRGASPARPLGLTATAKLLPPPAWGRDGVGGHPARKGARP